MAYQLNCIVVDDDKSSRIILKQLLKKTSTLNLVADCESAFEAAKVVQDELIDLIFLDVEMPEMSGLEFISTLRDKPQIILVTGKTKYATEAFNLDVTDFITKPIDPARFMRAVQKAQDMYERMLEEEPDPGPWIFIKDNGILRKLDVVSIKFIEAMADYTIIHTDKKKYTVYSTMHNLESKLPEKKFLRVHRSYILSLSRLETIEDSSAIIEKHIIPIGTTYRKRLLQRLNLI